MVTVSVQLTRNVIDELRIHMKNRLVDIAKRAVNIGISYDNFVHDNKDYYSALKELSHTSLEQEMYYNTVNNIHKLFSECICK